MTALSRWGLILARSPGSLKVRVAQVRRVPGFTLARVHIGAAVESKNEAEKFKIQIDFTPQNQGGNF